VSAPGRPLLRELDLAPRADLALRLTLVSLLLKPVGGAWTRPAIAGLAAAGLLFEAPRRSAWLWSTLLALATWRVASGWPLGDNHAYLLCYWLLAALLASRARDGDAALAWNARALIGLVFAFAVLWKLLLSPDYLDGRFFLVTLVDDARFESFTRLAAGLDVGALSALRDLVREHQDGLRPPLPGDPALPARLVAVAQALTGSLLALESALALAFLAPAATRVSRARDAILLCFCATAYALAPVEGFGWLLLCMGAAQCEPERTLTRRAYVTVFAIVLLASRWPWLRALAD
jgi:hypothetical protein